MALRILLATAMGGARLAELAYSARNLRRRSGVESSRNRAIYPLIIAIHTIAIVGTLLRGGRLVSPAWLALLIAAQPLRAWVMATLGERWNTRAAVPPDTRIETGGPYRYIRHPNYVVVVIELLALPMAFGLRRLAVAIALANAVLLAFRINEEERALLRVPGYREYMASVPRFIPKLF